MLRVLNVKTTMRQAAVAACGRTPGGDDRMMRAAAEIERLTAVLKHIGAGVEDAYRCAELARAALNIPERAGARIDNSIRNRWFTEVITN
jgi:hypothetical protein